MLAVRDPVFRHVCGIIYRVGKRLSVFWRAEVYVLLFLCLLSADARPVCGGCVRYLGIAGRHGKFRRFCGGRGGNMLCCLLVRLLFERLHTEQVFAAFARTGRAAQTGRPAVKGNG